MLAATAAFLVLKGLRLRFGRDHADQDGLRFEHDDAEEDGGGAPRPAPDRARERPGPGA
jgi:hypothetical protein